MSGTQRIPVTKYALYFVRECKTANVAAVLFLTGYMRAPQDKNHLLIDEEAANVVRRIYQMVISGMSLKAISDKLTEDKILIPSAYMEQCQNGNVSRNHSHHNPYRWNSTALAYILERQEYMGHTVLGKQFARTLRRRNAAKLLPTN